MTFRNPCPCYEKFGALTSIKAGPSETKRHRRTNLWPRVLQTWAYNTPPRVIVSNFVFFGKSVEFGIYRGHYPLFTVSVLEIYLRCRMLHVTCLPVWLHLPSPSARTLFPGPVGHLCVNALHFFISSIFFWVHSTSLEPGALAHVFSFVTVR